MSNRKYIIYANTLNNEYETVTEYVGFAGSLEAAMNLIHRETQYSQCQDFIIYETVSALRCKHIDGKYLFD